MLTDYPLSCTLGRSVLGIGGGVARFLMIAEYATYRYLQCVVNLNLLFRKLQNYGIRGVVGELITNYLCDRKLM